MNNAEKLWYGIDLYKVNCKKHQLNTVEEIYYSFGDAVIYSSSSSQHALYEAWEYIMPGSTDEKIEKFVCKKYK